MNIAEILKDVPRETKLYSPIFGEVLLEFVKDLPYPIAVCPLDGPSILRYFMEDGRYKNYVDGECLLFPSKEQRDWRRFKVDLPKDTLVVVFDNIYSPEDSIIRKYGGDSTYKTRAGNLFLGKYIVPLSKIKEVEGRFVFDSKDNYGRDSI